MYSTPLCRTAGGKVEAEVEKDALVFHGVEVDKMEQEAGGDKEVNRNFLEHNIKKILRSVWGIQCTAVFTHAYRSNIWHCAVGEKCKDSLYFRNLLLTMLVKTNEGLKGLSHEN